MKSRWRPYPPGTRRCSNVDSTSPQHCVTSSYISSWSLPTSPVRHTQTDAVLWSRWPISLASYSMNFPVTGEAVDSRNPRGDPPGWKVKCPDWLQICKAHHVTSIRFLHGRRVYCRTTNPLFVSQSVEHRGPALVRRYRRRANAGPRWCADGIRRLMGDLMAQPAITLNTLNTGFSTKMTTLVDQWLLCFPLPFHWRGFLQFAVVVYLGQTHSVVYLGGNLSIGK